MEVTGGNSYLGNSYYDDYYQNAYENALDPNKSLQMIGVSFGFGKRLEWPDDYFTLWQNWAIRHIFLKIGSICTICRTVLLTVLRWD